VFGLMLLIEEKRYSWVSLCVSYLSF